jgi:CheY-like chemotaxis protein
MGHTVMVVEDSADTRDVLRLTLLDRGYGVIEAVNGREAVEIASRKCPDLILMDLNMPHMDGLEAAERIRQCRQRCERVPILAMTAYDTYGMKDAALEAGCDDYILKPLDLDRLEVIISSLLADQS